ncbi:MAG: hypothetical protein M3R69_11060 [Acidobacteriota bacterium]|nr:hypothetical protein [Acidobacteriota bacterium]
MTTTETYVKILDAFAAQVASKLREASEAETAWQKCRKKVAQFAKDFGPLFTGIAAIMVSLSIGALTAAISILTLQSNKKQATVNQISLTTTALTDFAETDKEKRALAAIKVAAYGKDALPVIKFALGVKPNEIRLGGVEAAQVVYQSFPNLHQKLLDAMLLYFQDPNPSLRLGVLEFYREAAPQLAPVEREAFWNLLRNRLGTDAQSCVNEDGEFVLDAAQFLAKGLFPDARDYLLNIARNCPHEKGNQKYNGARKQAVGMLPIVLRQLRASKTERDKTVNSLRALELDGSEELKPSINDAISEIEKIQAP